jgi:hypothetical protein
MIKGVTIRKVDVEDSKRTQPSKSNIEKQILTLHRKLKKSDEVFTEYSVEKEPNGKGYHSHLKVQYNDENNLRERLQNFVGGNDWNKEIKGLELIESCNGKYGEVQLHNIDNPSEYSRYINKETLSKQLI